MTHGGAPTVITYRNSTTELPQYLAHTPNRAPCTTHWGVPTNTVHIQAHKSPNRDPCIHGGTPTYPTYSNITTDLVLPYTQATLPHRALYIIHHTKRENSQSAKKTPYNSNNEHNDKAKRLTTNTYWVKNTAITPVIKPKSPISPSHATIPTNQEGHTTSIRKMSNNSETRDTQDWKHATTNILTKALLLHGKPPQGTRAIVNHRPFANAKALQAYGFEHKNYHWVAEKLLPLPAYIYATATPLEKTLNNATMRNIYNSLTIPQYANTLNPQCIVAVVLFEAITPQRREELEQLVPCPLFPMEGKNPQILQITKVWPLPHPLRIHPGKNSTNNRAKRIQNIFPLDKAQHQQIWQHCQNEFNLALRAQEKTQRKRKQPTATAQYTSTPANTLSEMIGPMMNTTEDPVTKRKHDGTLDIDPNRKARTEQANKDKARTGGDTDMINQINARTDAARTALEEAKQKAAEDEENKRQADNDNKLHEQAKKDAKEKVARQAKQQEHDLQAKASATPEQQVNELFIAMQAIDDDDMEQDDTESVTNKYDDQPATPKITLSTRHESGNAKNGDRASSLFEADISNNPLYLGEHTSFAGTNDGRQQRGRDIFSFDATDPVAGHTLRMECFLHPNNTDSQGHKIAHPNFTNKTEPVMESFTDEAWAGHAVTIGVRLPRNWTFTTPSNNPPRGGKGGKRGKGRGHSNPVDDQYEREAGSNEVQKKLTEWAKSNELTAITPVLRKHRKEQTQRPKYNTRHPQYTHIMTLPRHSYYPSVPRTHP
jgi:hypothetical protein